MGEANAQETQAAGFLPVASSPQNPSLPPNRPICNKTHLYRHGLHSDSDPGEGPPRKDLQVHMILLVPGNLSVLPGGVKLGEERVGKLQPY